MLPSLMLCFIHIAFHFDKQTLIIINSTQFHEITINALKQFISKIELSLQMLHFSNATFWNSYWIHMYNYLGILVKEFQICIANSAGNIWIKLALKLQTNLI